MNKLYCPRCGYANNPESRFCKHCGFNLILYKRRMYTTSNSMSSLNHSVNMPQRSMYQYAGDYYRGQVISSKKRHIGLVISVIVISIIIILSLVGFGMYKNQIWPFEERSRGVITRQKSNDDASNNYSTVRNTWEHISANVGSKNAPDVSQNYANCFKNGTSNKAVKILNKWCNMMQTSNTTIESITPYDFYDIGNGKVGYKVRYDFKGNSNDHIQIYRWKSKVKNGKIVSMWNDSKPVKDYDN